MGRLAAHEDDVSGGPEGHVGRNEKLVLAGEGAPQHDEGSFIVAPLQYNGHDGQHGHDSSGLAGTKASDNSTVLNLSSPAKSFW